MIVMKRSVAMKITQLRILVVAGSKVVPRARKAAAVPSSARSSARPILALHWRHFPFKASQERMGMLSYHFNW